MFDVKPETDLLVHSRYRLGHRPHVSSTGRCRTASRKSCTRNTAPPTVHRHFEVIEKYSVSIYYTAPTLIRMFMKWGREVPDAHNLSSLRLLGSVGEPINPEAWRWYRDAFGGNRTPVVDPGGRPRPARS